MQVQIFFADTGKILGVEASPLQEKADAAFPDREWWIERLKSLRAHMPAAFGAGAELVGLDADFGLDVVRTVWPELANNSVKTGILKAFAFSKGLPDKHPHVVRVLHLGMTDGSAKVREYAADYLEPYAFRDFRSAPEAYRRWYRQYGDLSLDELRVATRPALQERLKEMREALAAGDRMLLSNLPGQIGDHGDPAAIPHLVDMIEADDTRDTIYGIGYFALGKLTGVPYSPEHDGKWWRQWWSEHKQDYGIRPDGAIIRRENADGTSQPEVERGSLSTAEDAARAYFEAFTRGDAAKIDDRVAVPFSFDRKAIIFDRRELKAKHTEVIKGFGKRKIPVYRTSRPRDAPVLDPEVFPEYSVVRLSVEDEGEHVDIYVTSGGVPQVIGFRSD